jgi:catechol 2,3-dioxygenase
MTHESIPAGTFLGHVHLKVADLDRAIRFYRDYLGFDPLVDLGSAAFLSAGGYHHHIGLNT